METSNFKNLNKRPSNGWWRWIKIIILIYTVIGIALYSFQEKLLLHPVALSQDYVYTFDVPFNEVNIPINKNENLNLVQFFPKDSIRKGVVLYFHGNMTNINHYAGAANIFTKNRYESLQKNNVVGDFQFIVMEKFLSRDNELPFFEKLIMKLHFWIKDKSLSEERGFGLEQSNVTVEKFPLIVAPVSKLKLKRIFPDEE
jgi:hypothetical protein